MTVDVEVSFPLPLPDDPQKWDGWSKYRSPNLYERLCLDPRANPSNELIEEHCRELLRWWQKKLPLKNQPSNPISQLLRPGLDESSRYLTEARVELLDPKRRRQMDDELAAQAQAEAIVEFQKYLTFALADGSLTRDEERNLLRFGAERGLPEERIVELLEAALKESGAQRMSSATPVATEGADGPGAPETKSGDPKEDFMRMLRLSNLDSDGMTDDTRDAFINMAENLGLDAGDAEDLVDVYLEEADEAANRMFGTEAPATPPAPIIVGAPKPAPLPVGQEIAPATTRANENARLANFQNSAGAEMVFVPADEFVMGSEASDAGPNERPLTKVKLSRFYMAKYPVTNAEYERFDPSHVRKRVAGAGDTYPVVYVSSLEAIKYCQWLATRERKKYRLPTEAEWEYAARGTDGRRYPWGNHSRRGDLANFADRNTVFAWSDHDIDDGYAESSPVGAFPLGASPFGLCDMAGNVWEWCLDYFEPYRGAPKVNPRGATSGAKRVYRGGSWKSRFNSLRATARGSNVPNYSCNDLGFRVVCESD
ncbi:MAG: formylglycine-generating enzyme family protein [Chthoniobacterales bacterium]